MNKITRTIGLTLATLTLTTGVGLTTAGTAIAAPIVPGNRCTDRVNNAQLYDIRSHHPAQTRYLTDYQILAAGHKAVVERKRRLQFQIGTVRTRILDGIATEVNNGFYGRGSWSVARYQAGSWASCNGYLI